MWHIDFYSFYVGRVTKSSVTKPLCTRNETGNKAKIQTKTDVIKKLLKSSDCVYM